MKIAYERGLHELGDGLHVLRTDVTLIGARMDGDALRSGVERDGRESLQARDAERACVTQGRDLVDVDGQSSHTGSLVPEAARRQDHRLPTTNSRLTTHDFCRR